MWKWNENTNQPPSICVQFGIWHLSWQFEAVKDEISNSNSNSNALNEKFKAFREIFVCFKSNVKCTHRWMMAYITIPEMNTKNKTCARIRSWTTNNFLVSVCVSVCISLSRLLQKKSYFIPVISQYIAYFATQ